ncbi:MAG: LLM class flavin-dependent oxidoreductase [Chloroflexota bacterium]|nr:LLM class flavin-dependent oxidoreductase [Chloroflexota bacterium]
MSVAPFEIGLYSFVENTTDPQSGRKLTPQERMNHLLEEIELADSVGLDVFGIGEHHREEYVSSAPEVILAAAAARTQRIRLSSAVTVLSSDDPVRVFQRFATVDLISNGRAEILAGRGSFIESFPLFGYDLHDYDDLFSEKLDLLLKIREQERVRWQGGHRPAIDNLPVYPRPVQQPLPVWVGVGGTPESVARAASRGLPMALAIIGGMPEQFAPFVQLHRHIARESGYTDVPISINSHGFIADTRQQALDESFPAVQVVMNKIGRERGWAPMRRDQYDAAATLRGANCVGSPDDVIEKILFQHRIFGHQRFLLQLTVGSIEHDKVLRAIELMGTKVAPVVRERIAEQAAALAL